MHSNVQINAIYLLIVIHFPGLATAIFLVPVTMIFVESALPELQQPTPRPRPRPIEPPAAFLPPPGGRSGGSPVLGLRSGGERSFARNSIALPPRSQFSRKANVNQRNQSSQSNKKTHANRRNKFGNQRQFNQQPASISSAQQNRNPISGRGNWDLFGKLGLISRKG